MEYKSFNVSGKRLSDNCHLELDLGSLWDVRYQNHEILKQVQNDKLHSRGVIG